MTERERFVKRTALIILAFTILATLCFIFSNSMQSRTESGETSGRLSAWLKSIIDPRDRIDDEDFHHFIRKLAHFAEFFLLSAQIVAFRFIALGRLFDEGFFLPMFCTLAAAVCDEYIQFFSDRGSLVQDVVIDFSGGLTGGLLCGLVILFVCRRRGQVQSEKEARLADSDTSSGRTDTD